MRGFGVSALPIFETRADQLLVLNLLGKLQNNFDVSSLNFDEISHLSSGFEAAEDSYDVDCCIIFFSLLSRALCSLESSFKQNATQEDKVSQENKVMSESSTFANNVLLFERGKSCYENGRYDKNLHYEAQLDKVKQFDQQIETSLAAGGIENLQKSVDILILDDRCLSGYDSRKFLEARVSQKYLHFLGRLFCGFDMSFYFLKMPVYLGDFVDGLKFFSYYRARLPFQFLDILVFPYSRRIISLRNKSDPMQSQLSCNQFWVLQALMAKYPQTFLYGDLEKYYYCSDFFDRKAVKELIIQLADKLKDVCSRCSIVELTSEEYYIAVDGTF